jgi:nicotinate-nucleotide adenylyltransferase
MIARTRTGVFGGTFDPVHLGHVDAARAAADALSLDRILFVPANVPPHRRQEPVASSFHRFAMVALTVLMDDRFCVSDVEVASAGPSYTARTLARLQENGSDPSQLFVITGADAFAYIHTWNDYPDLLDRGHFVVISRPGASVAGLGERLPSLAYRMIEPAEFRRGGDKLPTRPSIVLIDAVTSPASSTDIRRRVAAGEGASEWLAPGVERYIRRHGLYRVR